MQVKKERLNHNLPPLSNKADDDFEDGGEFVVVRSKVKHVAFFLSREAEQMIGRILPSVL